MPDSVLRAGSFRHASGLYASLVNDHSNPAVPVTVRHCRDCHVTESEAMRCGEVWIDRRYISENLSHGWHIAIDADNHTACGGHLPANLLYPGWPKECDMTTMRRRYSAAYVCRPCSDNAPC